MVSQRALLVELNRRLLHLIWNPLCANTSASLQFVSVCLRICKQVVLHNAVTLGYCHSDRVISSFVRLHNLCQHKSLNGCSSDGQQWSNVSGDPYGTKELYISFS